MAGLHRRSSLLPVVAAVLLLAGLVAAAAKDASDGNIKIKVRYPTEEESPWLDRWAAKYQSPSSGSGSDDGFSVQAATDEESAYLNRMVANANKRAAEGSRDGRGAAVVGFDGHLEFDENDQFGQLVVDAMHYAGASKTEDDLGNQEEKSHAESDVQDL